MRDPLKSLSGNWGEKKKTLVSAREMVRAYADKSKIPEQQDVKITIEIIVIMIIISPSVSNTT